MILFQSVNNRRRQHLVLFGTVSLTENPLSHFEATEYDEKLFVVWNFQTTLSDRIVIHLYHTVKSALDFHLGIRAVLNVPERRP